jgi:integrase
MQPAMVNGMASTDFWMLEVIGKGSKVRTVPISDSLRSMILLHHEDVRRMLREAGESSRERLRAFERRPPLVCALRAPVGHETAVIDDAAAMANDNLSLGKIGLYRVIKSFFVGATKPHIKACEKRLVELEGKSKVTEAKGDEHAVSILLESKKEARRELATWLRRSTMTTHWMRHTFAIGILRDNPNDAGLKLAQQLLGHASIATTQIYLKVDDTAKTKAVLNHKPFGS